MPAPKPVVPPADVDAENTQTTTSDTGNGGAPQPPNEPALGPAKEPGDLGTLGHYRVLKKIGIGGMGIVYVGFDESLHRKVALKVMLPKVAANAAAKERFLREARASAAVEHPNVVSIYQVGEHAGVPFIAMQYLQGTPLDKYLAKKGLPSLVQIFRVAKETAEGLAAAHGKGLVHRDIKPANLWLEAPHGHVKILDFGLAKPTGEDHDGSTELTQTGAVVGTPAYMAPEQARAQPVDARTDLYSLGAVLYRLCTGKQPFSGPNVMAVLSALALDKPVPIRDVNPAIPEGLANLIHKLLEKDPAQRPKNAQEVVSAIKAIEKKQTGTDAAPALAPTGTPLETPALPPVFAIPATGLSGHLSDTEPGASAFANLDDSVVSTPSPSSRSKVKAAKSSEVPALTDANPAAKKSLPAWAAIAGGVALVAVLATVAFLVLNDREKITESQPDPIPPRRTPEPKPRPTVVLNTANPAPGNGKFKPLAETWLKKFETGDAITKVDMIEKELYERNPGFNGKLKSTETDGAIVALECNSNLLSDLTPFSVVKSLTSLTITGGAQGEIEDLTPLAGLPLQSLTLSGNARLSNLAPLKSMPLTLLKVNQTAVSDFTPLAGKKLTALHASGCSKLSSLESLAGCEVEELYVHHTNITSVAALANQRGLKSLYWNCDKIKDLSPLKDCPLEHIRFEPPGYRLPIDYFDVLRNSPLKDVQQIPAKDFWATQEMRRKATTPPKQGLQAHENEATSLALSADGATLVSSGIDGRIRFWNAETLEPGLTIKAPASVWKVAYVPGTESIVTQSAKQLQFWNAKTGAAEGAIEVPPESCSGLAVSSDGKRVMTGGWKGDFKIYQWSLPDRTPLEPLPGPGSGILLCSYSQDGRYAITAGAQRKTWVWDLTERKPVYRSTPATSGTSVATVVSSDGQLLHCDDSGVLARIDWQSGVVTELAPLLAATRAMLDPGGERVVVGHRDGWISIVDYKTGALRQQINCNSSVRSFVYSRDGKTLFSSHLDGHIRTWDFAAIVSK